MVAHSIRMPPSGATIPLVPLSPLLDKNALSRRLRNSRGWQDGISRAESLSGAQERDDGEVSPSGLAVEGNLELDSRLITNENKGCGAS
jgi:hypothetical protein